MRSILLWTVPVALAFAALVAGGAVHGEQGAAERPVPLPPAWSPALTPATVAEPMPVPTETPAAAVVVEPAAAETPAPDGYVIRRVLDIPGPMRPGDYYWDESGAPAGRVVITADLKAQTLSVFRAGYEIGTAVILYGADDKPTPLGVFPITQKKAQHTSTLYDAEMPYMQRLTSDGVAIHGAEVGPNRGTHGCIGVPTPFAKLLFGVTKLGDVVIVTNGEMLQSGGAITAAR